jgi:hypothetical protein
MDSIYLTCDKAGNCIHDPDIKKYKDHFKKRDMNKEIKFKE